MPEGTAVDIVGTSTDVIHGLRIPNAGVSLQLLLGGMARAIHRLSTPGEPPFLCDLLCGPGRANMRGAIVVNASSGAASNGGTPSDASADGR